MKSESFKSTYAKVFEACKIVITKSKYKLESEDKQNGIICISTPSTIFSWGEEIMVIVKKIDTDTTNITVESLPKAQLFDWGKSEENEYRIITCVENILGE